MRSHPLFGGFMEVVFYQTKLSDSNRCYGAANYDSYLASCNKKTVTLSHDVVPNNSFNIETTTAMWQYNYITFVYRGYKFGAFIDNVSIQAISGTTVIRHHTDNWYFVLQNIGINNIDFHGQVARAHVNDYVKKSDGVYPTLDNTTATPEEQFNTGGLTYSLSRVLPEPSDDFHTYAWLHIYCANIEAALRTPYGITVDPQRSQYRNNQVLPNNGITFSYLVAFPWGYPLGAPKFYIYDGNDKFIYASWFRLDKLTSGEITAMTFSPYCPDSPIKHTYHSDGDYFDNFGGDNWVVSTGTTGAVSKRVGLPDEACFCLEWNFADFKEYFTGTQGSRYDREDIAVSEKTNYSDYIVSFPKLRSSIYQPSYFGDTFIYTIKNTTPPSGSQYKDYCDIIYILTFDLRTYICLLPNGAMAGNQNAVMRSNVGVFVPDTQLDYWTRQNALQSTLSAQITRNKAVIQGVKNSVGVAKSVVGTAGSAAGIAGSLVGGDISGAVSSGAGVASGIVDIVEKSVNFGRNQENVQLQQRSANIAQEVAEYQYAVGSTRSDVSPSYCTSFFDSSISCYLIVSQSDKNKQIIGKNLHRFGYNTFLQLDDVYFNHKRTHFNYIQTIDASVVGVPSDIAADLENMFNSGVHLWQDDVENFEQTNYQEGLFNV